MEDTGEPDTDHRHESHLQVSKPRRTAQAAPHLVRPDEQWDTPVAWVRREQTACPPPPPPPILTCYPHGTDPPPATPPPPPTPSPPNVPKRALRHQHRTHTNGRPPQQRQRDVAAAQPRPPHCPPNRPVDGGKRPRNGRAKEPKRQANDHQLCRRVAQVGQLRAHLGGHASRVGAGARAPRPRPAPPHRRHIPDGRNRQPRQPPKDDQARGARRDRHHRVLVILKAQPVVDLERKEAAAEGHAEKGGQRARHPRQRVRAEALAAGNAKEGHGHPARNGRADSHQRRLGAEGATGEDGRLGGDNHGGGVAHWHVAQLVDAGNSVAEVAGEAQKVDADAHEGGKEHARRWNPQPVQ